MTRTESQYYGIIGRQRHRTMSSICRPSWKEHLPYPWHRLQIRNKVELWAMSPTPGEEPLGKEDWSAAPSVPPLAYIGFLDPLLAGELIHQVYPTRPMYIEGRHPYSDFMYQRSHGLARNLMELEVRLCQLVKSSIDYKECVILPLAALVSDSLRLISNIECELSQNNSPGTLECESTVWLKNMYISTYGMISDSQRVADIHVNQMRAKIEPAMPRLGSLDLFDALLFSFRRPGPRIHPLKPTIDEGMNVTDSIPKTRINWPRLTELEEPVDSSQNKLQDKIDRLHLDFSNIDAAYICSGPFRLMFTTRLEDHFLLDATGYLHVFWNFDRSFSNGFDVIENHFLWDYDGQTSK